MFNLGLGLLFGGLVLSSIWGTAGFLLSLCGLGVWLFGVGQSLWTLMLGGTLPQGPSPVSRVQRAAAPEPALEEDRRVALDDPEIPPSIRAMVQQDAQPGDVLVRRVSTGGSRGLLGMGHRPLVLEWWLLDADGELIEAYWLER